MIDTGLAARPTVLVVFGTRPEAIKLAPVIRKLRQKASCLRCCVCVTAQHREMLDQVLSSFDIEVDHDLGVMQPNQTLFDITRDTLTGLQKIIEVERPQMVMVQGDTTTTFSAALTAFYMRVPVAHVEAGLRTYNTDEPFPEEMNRRLTDSLSTLLFAPTELGRTHLLAEGHAASSIFVTGNTGIDALLMTVNRAASLNHPLLDRIDFRRRRVILVTAHRRESFGGRLANVCQAIRTLVSARPDVEVIYPVHLNPNVQEPVRQLIGGAERIHLIEPLPYSTFVQLLDRCFLIMTDSGGVQEEAPSLGKPVLVLRETTERNEAIEAGTALLVGTDPERIVAEAARLLDDETTYARRTSQNNPFGDGQAAKRIVDVVVGALSKAVSVGGQPT